MLRSRGIDVCSLSEPKQMLSFDPMMLMAIRSMRVIRFSRRVDVLPWPWLVAVGVMNMVPDANVMACVPVRALSLDA
jgi:hypothetical protein